MDTNMIKPLFNFCYSAPTRNLELLRLLAEQAQVNTVNDPESLYGQIVDRAVLIIDDLRGIALESVANVYATQVIGFLDTSVFEKIVNTREQTDENVLNTAMFQLLFVMAALVIDPTIVPYDPSEIAELINPESQQEVNQLILASTIGYVITTGVTGYTGLMRLLPTEAQTDIGEAFTWEDAFLLGIMVHLAWSFFPNASERDQVFLLQHYVYRAIVMGVPVRTWLAYTFTEPMSGAKATQCVQALLNSVELIPNNTNLFGAKKFSEVTHDYISAAVRETIPTLAQEKYLKNWYDTSTEGEQYRTWLRDALTIVYKLQTNTIHRA